MTVPQALIQEGVMTIPGIDGRKMSKNYSNTIPIFADANTLHEQVMRIVTESKRTQDPNNAREIAGPVLESERRAIGISR